jgi:steroid 5-alpha reductase family enzyme
VLKNKSLSLLLIAIVYVLSFGAGGAALYFLKGRIPPLVNLFIADTTATVIVYIFNLFFKNASFYDPYWSVQPPLLLAGFYFVYGVPFQAVHLWAVIPLILWAIRLTVNWAVGFDNLAWQDWRYRSIKEQNPRHEKAIVFFGIMYMPTCLVFLGTIPLWYMVNAVELSPLPPCLGGIVILTGTILEFIADREMKRYKADPRRGPYIYSGLWKYSRHPNYLGEILVWTGLFIAGLQNFHSLSLPGALLIIVLFITTSIPMMEKHLLARTPLYRDYQRDVPMLLPLPPRRGGSR